MFKKTFFNLSKLFSIAAMVVLLLTAFAPAVQAKSELASTCGATYVVQPGDWMSKIARYCGVSYSALVSANPQIANPSIIYAGQVLNIPSSGAPVPYLTITPTSGLAGTTITLKGTGFTPSSAVHYGVAQQGGYNPDVPAVNSDANGAFTATVAIPTSAQAGQHWQAYAYVEGKLAAVYSNLFLVTSSNSNGGNTCNYTIQRGDTLQKIAYKYNTTVQAILAVNPQIVNPNLVYPGQVIVIPSCTGTGGIPSPTPIPQPTGGPTYYVQAGDTLRIIANRFGTSVDAILAVNPQITNANLIYVGQAIKLPSGINSYAVQRGDTLNKISVWFGVPLQTLLNLNPQITNMNIIYVGQVIKLK